VGKIKTFFCSHEVRLAKHSLKEMTLTWECVKCGAQFERSPDQKFKWARVDMDPEAAVVWANSSRRQRKFNKRQGKK
jgi:hypothetical protein